MRQIARYSALVLGLLLSISQQSAFAAVWGYVDARGVAHFAADKMDDRYELFFRGDETGEKTAEPAAPAVAPEAAGPRNLPASSPKLFAFFDVSPAYKQVKHHLREASSEHSVDYELLQALIATESGFDSSAVSPKGAIGLMQLIPATAQRFGVAGDKRASVEKKLTDPKTNVMAGTRYLRTLIDMFEGKLELALAAYNAGEGAVQRAGRRIPNYPETQNYVKAVMQLYALLKPPAAPRRMAVPAPAPLPGGRLRVQLGVDESFATHEVRVAAPVGGAVGRGNMVPPAVAALLAAGQAAPRAERE